MLGRLCVRQGDREITRFRTHKTAVLLARLAYFPGRSHPREELIDLLWPDCDSELGRNSLSKSLSSLRNQLEPPGVPMGALIVADRENVKLNPAGYTSDVSEFAAALQAAQKLDHTPEKVGKLQNALQLYTGPLLPGHYEDWNLTERDRLSELFFRAATQVIVHRELAGELKTALDIALSSLEADPLREEMHLAAMRLFHKLGDSRAALRQFATLRGLLERDLGAEPGPKAVRLAEQIRAASPPEEALDIPDLQPDLSPSRRQPAQYPAELDLRSDLADQEPTSLTAAASEGKRAKGLPLRFDRFFGREREIDLVHEWLGNDEIRLITLTGPGGSGKTRLAVEAADRFHEPLKAQVIFVPLAAARDRAGVCTALLAALGVQQAPVADPVEQIVGSLNERTLIVVLDNLEQVVEETAPVIQAILSGAPNVKCVATSRMVLGLGAEREFAVQPLPIPKGVTDVEQLAIFESVQLFTDRAQRVKPDFQITQHNAGTIAELCDRLEGIPLALELAAARAQVLTPQQMLAQLDDRYGFLVSRRRDLDERHRTLKAAVDWSFDLLPEELRRFFAQLSVFRGTWDLSAVEIVCGEPLALDYLAQLQECSLIQAVNSGDGRADEIRFRMMQSLREYASAKLAPEDEAEARERHGLYFTELAVQESNEMNGPRQAAALSRMDRDYDNISSALAYYARLKKSAEGLVLANACGHFWNARGRLAEGRRILKQLLAECDEVPARNRMEALHWQGMLAYSQGEFDRSRRHHEQSFELAKLLDDEDWKALQLHRLGWCEFELGDYDTARPLFQQALEIRSGCEDEWDIQSSLSALGVLASNMAEYDESQSLFESALEIQTRLGDESAVASSINNLGIVARRRGDFENARSLYERALQIRQRLGDPRSLAAAESNMGMALYNLGRLTEAKDQFVRSLELRREIGDQWGLANSLSNLGIISLAQGDTNSAMSLQRESLRIRSHVGDRLGIAVCLESLAEALLAKADMVLAAKVLSASIALRSRIKTPKPHSEVHEVEAMKARLRAGLSDKAFDRIWTEAAETPLDKIVDEALA